MYEPIRYPYVYDKQHEHSIHPVMLVHMTIKKKMDKGHNKQITKYPTYLTIMCIYCSNDQDDNR